MKTTTKRNAFTLVEMLLVLAIISVMAAMVINAFSNATNDSRNVISRQQQATLQSALNNWISQEIRGTQTVKGARDKYNYTFSGGAYTTTELTMDKRLEHIKEYIDVDFYNHLVAGSSTTKVRSGAMAKTGQYIVFSKWDDPSSGNSAPYPKVELIKD